MNLEEKCQHGVYKAGHSKALHCQMCTPLVPDITLRGLPKFKPSLRGAVSERTLSAAAFMAQSVGARLATLEEAA